MAEKEKKPSPFAQGGWGDDLLEGCFVIGGFILCIALFVALLMVTSRELASGIVGLIATPTR